MCRGDVRKSSDRHYQTIASYHLKNITKFLTSTVTPPRTNSRLQEKMTSFTSMYFILKKCDLSDKLDRINSLVKKYCVPEF